MIFMYYFLFIFIFFDFHFFIYFHFLFAVLIFIPFHFLFVVFISFPFGAEAKGIYNKSLAELDRINVAVQLGSGPWHDAPGGFRRVPLGARPRTVSIPYCDMMSPLVAVSQLVLQMLRWCAYQYCQYAPDQTREINMCFSNLSKFPRGIETVLLRNQSD